MNGDAETMPRSGTGAVTRPKTRRRSFPLAPVIVFVGVWLGGSGLIVGAWLHPVIPGGWATIAAVLALVAIPVRTFVRGIAGGHYPSRVVRLLILRPFWYAMLFMPVLAIATLVGGLAGLPFSASGPAGRWALSIAGTVMALVALAGYLDSRRLVVRQLDVRMPRLPKAFDGLRVVQISDLHVGPHTPRRFLERISAAVRDASPDLIAVTGDQVDDFAQDVEVFNSAFDGLRAPLGTFIVAGNHDVYAGWDAVQRGLSAAGFSVLVNEAVSVERQGVRLWVAGTGDPAAKGWPQEGGAAPDVAQTLAAVPSDEPVLVLAHNPALWPALASQGADLTLSGHTHYGQFAVPSRGWSMASPFLKLAMGWHRHNRSLLYIHPGTNYWGIPFRLGTPPEVTVLTLRASNGDAGIEA